MATDIHIGIVTYNSMDEISGCVQAIRKQSYPDIRLSVVDNASTDGIVTWLQANLPSDELHLNQHNRGFAAGHNQIIDTIGTAHYLALNPDVIMHPDYITALIDTMQRHQAGWGVGKLYHTGSNFQEINGNLRRAGSQTLPNLYSTGHALLPNGYAFNIGYGESDNGQYNDEREIFGAPGAAVLYTNALIHDLGLPFFDDTLFTYSEDVDVDWQAQRRGWSCCYSPQAIAHHRGGQPSPDMHAAALANRYLSALKNACPRQLIRAIVPMLLLHSLFRLLITPRLGWLMTTRIVRHAPVMLRKRQALPGACERMMHWFAWSREQQSQQPCTLNERLRAFWQTHHTL